MRNPNSFAKINIYLGVIGTDFMIESLSFFSYLFKKTTYLFVYIYKVFIVICTIRRSNAEKTENPENLREKEKRARECSRGGGAGREMNDPVSRCTEVIKSRQIFSLSRRVSDTYIILKGLFRGALYPGRNEPDPGSSRKPSRGGRTFFRAASLRKCVRELSRAISLVFVYTLAPSFSHRTIPLLFFYHPVSSLYTGLPFSDVAIEKGRDFSLRALTRLPLRV